MQHFVLQFPLVSINDVRSMHHYTLAKKKKEASELIAWQLKSQGIERFDTPVSIVYEISWKDKRRRDLENYAYNVKFIHDVLLPQNKSSYGLGIVEDDDYTRICNVSLRPGRFIGKETRIDMFMATSTIDYMPI